MVTEKVMLLFMHDATTLLSTARVSTTYTTCHNALCSASFIQATQSAAAAVWPLEDVSHRSFSEPAC